MHTLPQTGVLTFLFTDIEGSTARWDRTPDAMASALLTHDQILNETLTLHGGSIFKRVGDAFCTAFARPHDAIAAAVDAQRKLGEHAWDQAIGALHVRIGIHTGSALSSDDDYYGPALNRVARITGAAHGGQILLSHTTHSLVRADLPPGIECVNLGQHRLRDLAEAETIYEIAAPGLRKDFPPLQTLDARPNNLPLELSSFVGRADEIRALSELITKYRLVTLCGPGGIGKTRLALHVAAAELDEFKDGVWFVRLAPASDATLIAQTIAAAMNIAEAPGEPVETTLLRELCARHVLLVLDNAEHVLAGVAATVRTILDRCKHVRVLTTTRESLHVSGEQVYRLGPVAAQIAKQLFMERAQAATRDFQIGTADAEDFEAIIVCLQGIPLAIELAAARVSMFSLRQIRERLGAQLTFLRTQASDDDRHRTLKETIAWSYALLPQPERDLLGELSVFADSFTLEACEYIDPDALDRLEALVDKSLLTTVREAEMRYRMLEAIREYAAEQTAAADLQNTRAKHYRFFAGIAAQGTHALPHESLRVWLQSVDHDLANIRTAISYGFDTQDSELGTFLVGIWRYWLIRRTIKEGRAWLRRYIESAPKNQVQLAAVLRRASSFASIEGDYAESETLAKRALTIYHELKDEAGILEALHALAVNENRRGNYSGAERLYGDIAGRCAEAGQQRAAVTSTANCASIKLQRGDLQSAEALLTQCLRGANELADDDVLGTILALHGTLAYKRNEFSAAEEYFRKGLQLKERLGNEFGIAEISAALALVYAKQGDIVRSADFAQRSLAIAVQLEEFSQLIIALEACALAAFHEGAYEIARDHFTLAAQLRHAHLLQHHSGLAKEELATALQAHYGISVEQAITSGSPGNWRAAVNELGIRWRASAPLSSLAT